MPCGLSRRVGAAPENLGVAALAQLGNAQLRGPSACLPGAVAVTVALYDPLLGLRAVSGSGETLDLQLH